MNNLTAYSLIMKKSRFTIWLFLGFFGILAVSPVSILSQTVLAQGPFDGQTPPPGLVSAVGRKIIESSADGTTTTAMYFAAMNSADMRRDIGFTEEQNRQMREMRSLIQAEALKRMPQVFESFKNFNASSEREIAAEVQDGIAKIRGRLDEIVTPAQKAKAQTLSFQAFGGLDSPFVNPEMLSTLNLSEDQKEKAKALFQETEKERVEIMEAGLKLAEKAVAAGGPRMSAEDRNRLEQEGRALEGRVYASGKKLGSKIRDFLTDAQKKQADDLMANRPSYLGRLPRQLRPDENDSEWKPNDSSWAPGQGVSGDLVPSEERRFPVRRRVE